MTKQQEFLWLIEQYFLCSTLHNIRWPAENIEREDTSLTGNVILFNEALRASRLIPDKMSSSDAAEEFFNFMSSLRRKQINLPQVVPNPPWWFGRII